MAIATASWFKVEASPLAQPQELLSPQERHIRGLLIRHPRMPAAAPTLRPLTASISIFRARENLLRVDQLCLEIIFRSKCASSRKAAPIPRFRSSRRLRSESVATESHLVCL